MIRERRRSKTIIETEPSLQELKNQIITLMEKPINYNLLMMQSVRETERARNIGDSKKLEVQEYINGKQPLKMPI